MSYNRNANTADEVLPVGLKNNGDGSGDGDGDGNGYGNGYGDGDGYGDQR